MPRESEAKSTSSSMKGAWSPISQATSTTGYWLGRANRYQALVSAMSASLIGVSLPAQGLYTPELMVPVGRAASGTFGTLGATGGAETHQLTVAQMPTHQHTYGDSRAASQASTGTNPVHGTAFNNSNYNTSFSGGNEAHNNLQPYRVINFIIKAR